MVLLEDRKVTIKQNPYAKASSFIIERVEIPAELSAIAVNLRVPKNMVKLVLIYDSHYNLRAEISNINSPTEIMIAKDRAHTSLGAKSGSLPDGEWIIAFEINYLDKLNDSELSCHFIVRAIK